MALGQSQTRGDRRRRVLTEELLGTAADQPASAHDQSEPHNGTGARRYTEAASYENQTRLSDLVPRWRITIALFWLIGAGLVAALIGLHLHQADLAAMLGQSHLATLDLASLGNGMTGGLGVWLASSALGLAAMGCLLIYSIRRYRIDDYHGRYRIWLWIAAVCLLLSVNTTADLHMPLVRAAVDRTGWTALVDGAVWWLVPLTVLAATFGVRLLAEVRQCRTSCTSLLAAYACWAGAVVIHLGLLVVGEPLITTAVIAGTTLAGHVLLLTALALYARHVVLDAEGLLPQRFPSRDAGGDARPAKGTAASKSRRSAKPADPPTRRQAAKGPTPTAAAKTAKLASGRRRTDLDSGTTAKAKPAARDAEAQWTDGTDATAPSDESDDRSESRSRKLSKADRKRLRKQRQRDRQRHAA